ncbi:hypothetical protein [Prosthecobacter sp.]|uniref:hypothetical protein n=1 Tax=Prosthecobacter sp. TaxID=1965333 RepID=UPI003784BD9E
MKPHRILPCLLAVWAVLNLASCVVPDPAYAHEAAAVRNVEYPSGKIVGRWFYMMYMPIATTTQNMEDKHSYDLRSNGSGTHRQFTKNMVNGHYIELEGPVTWSYLGNNRWQINHCRAMQYRVVRKNGMSISHDRAIPPAIVRYANGKLFEPRGMHIWVPFSASAVEGQISRMRASRAANQIYLNTGPTS